MHSSCWAPVETAGLQIQSRENCLICSEALEYYQVGKDLTCMKCTKKEKGYVNCPNGHYVCDDCHGEERFDEIVSMIYKAEGINPFVIANELIKESNIPMLGCEHAWIAAGALTIAIRNEKTIKIEKEDIDEALNRTKKQAIGAYCGLTGVCGIAPAIGSVYSVILGAACPKDKETSNTMYVVAKVIEAISKEAGPCCCKNFVYKALDVACEYSYEYLNVKLESSYDILCEDSSRHPHGCRKEKCSYYGE